MKSESILEAEAMKRIRLVARMRKMRSDYVILREKLGMNHPAVIVAKKSYYAAIPRTDAAIWLGSA